jgi:hypothetical protein
MELARERSDGLLQQLVFAMRGGARWHMHVVEIAKQYRGGWNESDQIHRALTEIGAIGLAMGTSVQCKRLWSIMESWEFVGRALFRRSRGHARHVLNVFWLGYLLFHHPLLKERFREMWRNIVSSRMPTAHEEDPMEGLSDAWLYASLFHDVGGCFEKAAGTAQETARLLGQFRVLMAGDNEVEGATVEIRAELMAEARMIFEEMGAEATNVFLPIWQKSLDEKKYDHGVISAMLIRNLVTEGVQAEYAKEAARAMAIHNLIGELGETVTTVVRWEENPIGAMLLLCDQLQTWDRERGIERLADLDGSERAGLTGVNVESDFSGAICVTLGIDYLGQSHIARHPVYTRVRQNLEGILQDYPIRTLLRVGSPWPFVLRPKFWLMGRKLQTECEFK